MNATVTPEGRQINVARSPLRSHFDEPQKNEVHLLYLKCVFYIVDVHYVRTSVLIPANKWRRKVIIQPAWLLRSKAFTMT